MHVFEPQFDSTGIRLSVDELSGFKPRARLIQSENWMTRNPAWYRPINARLSKNEMDSR